MIDNYDGVKELALTIVTQMVKDYHNQLLKLKLNDFSTERKKRDAQRAVIDYEHFFKSDRFKLYSNFDGRKIIRIINERVKDETIDQ